MFKIHIIIGGTDSIVLVVSGCSDGIQGKTEIDFLSILEGGSLIPGADRVGFWWDLSQPTDCCPLAISSWPLCVLASGISSSYRDISPIVRTYSYVLI